MNLIYKKYLTIILLLSNISIASATEIIWHFDEGNGDKIKDSTGNYEGSIYNIIWTEGKMGGAILLNGNAYVRIPNFDKLNPVDNIELELWFKHLNIPQIGYHKIVSKPYTRFDDPWQQYAINLVDDQIVFEVTTGGVNTELFSNFKLENNTWYHIKGIYDGSEMKIYIDDILKNRHPKIGNIDIFQTDLYLGAGIYGNEDKEYIIGIIDELKITVPDVPTFTPTVVPTTPIQTPTVVPTTPIQTLTVVPTTHIADSETHISLYGEKTDVVIDEDILLRLSAVNLINKPMMTVQVILYPPSGMSITGQEFVKSGAGIYTTTYKLDPGDSKDIEIKIKPNQIGDFNVKGVIVYYFGDDKNTVETITKMLPIKVSNKKIDHEGEFDIIRWFLNILNKILGPTE